MSNEIERSGSLAPYNNTKYRSESTWKSEAADRTHKGYTSQELHCGDWRFHMMNRSDSHVSFLCFPTFIYQFIFAQLAERTPKWGHE